MRKVLAFLVWLFSFWIWKDFFLRCLRRSPFYPASGGTAGSEHLPCQEGYPESEWARFLSSLLEEERGCSDLDIRGDSSVILYFGWSRKRYTWSDMQVGYREFLGAVASSEVVFHEEVQVHLRGDDSLKHMEAFADTVLQSGNAFRKLRVVCFPVSPIPFAKCISRALLGNDAIEDLHVDLRDLNGKMNKELTVQFMAIVEVPHILQILKSFTFSGYELDDEGVEELVKPFKSPDGVLERLSISDLASDAQLERISDLLATSTSLKRLYIHKYVGIEKRNECTRGYTSIAFALCTNRSLQRLDCENSSSMELKALLDPLMPKTNNLQPNTTLTHLKLSINVGGKEGIQTLVPMLRTNISLLDLTLYCLHELSSEDAQAIDNVVAILEALKTNKSLKKISFYFCTTVGRYKVLGAMMDLLLENHCIEDIDLDATGLEKSRDAEYVYSALSKRKKIKLWDIVQGMANVKPSSEQVFLCGQPFAGKTQLRLSMKKLKEFQPKDEVQNTPRIRNRMQRAFKRPKVPIIMVPKEDMPLQRIQGIEVDNVLCDDIRISIWDMASQTDYHSFHELVMPNFSADGSCSIFLLMCDPMERLDPSKKQSLTSVKEELESWLRFIASNTRRSNSYRPHVLIVMTDFDYWKNEGRFAARIEEEVIKLKVQFQEVLEFDDNQVVFKVDGRNIFDACKVFDFIKSHLKQLLERLPKTISACEEVQRLVEQWNANKSNPLLLKWDEFCETMCKDKEDFNIENHELAKRRKAFVAISLSEGGHIIYNENEGVVITNPHWFCHDIMGQLLHQCSEEVYQLDMVLSNGVISLQEDFCPN